MSKRKKKHSLLNEYGIKQSDIPWDDKNEVQKIGSHIRSVFKEVKIIHKAINRATKIKKEGGVNNDNMWKRTHKQIEKLNGEIKTVLIKLNNLRA